MAFELLLAPRCNDQISHLRRQETSKPTHTLYFANLIGDTLALLAGEIDAAAGYAKAEKARATRRADGTDFDHFFRRASRRSTLRDWSKISAERPAAVRFPSARSSLDACGPRKGGGAWAFLLAGGGCRLSNECDAGEGHQSFKK